MDFGKAACSLHLRVQLSDLPSFGTALAILRGSQAYLLSFTIGSLSLRLIQKPQFIVIHIPKGFGIVNKAEIDVFLELSRFFDRSPKRRGSLRCLPPLEVRPSSVAPDPADPILWPPHAKS